MLSYSVSIPTYRLKKLMVGLDCENRAQNELHRLKPGAKHSEGSLPLQLPVSSVGLVGFGPVGFGWSEYSPGY